MIPKIGGVADSLKYCQMMQRDIDQLQRVQKWHMEFNPRECEEMHFGRLNVRRGYRINGTDMQRYLGDQIQ